MSQNLPAAPATAPTKTADLVRSLDVRWRLGLALLVGGLAAWLLPRALSPWIRPTEIGPLARTVMGWVGFGAADLGQVLLGMWEADTDDIRKVAASEDLPRNLGFVLVLGAAIASLGTVVGMLRGLDKLPAHVCTLHVGLSIAAVVLAWLLVHTVFTLRYAHTYYDQDEETGRDVGGLIFPDDQNDQDAAKPKLKPNYIDFAYFSFVIGMTAQTADIAIANRDLRGIALLHGCVSFLFNTVIVALTIGTVGGLLN